MFKQIINSITIVFKYAKIPTLIKVIQVFIVALFTPLNIYFTQKLIDNIGLYLKKDISFNNIIIWIILLFLSMLFSASNNLFDTIININIQRKINVGITQKILDKFRKIKYEFFEDKEIADTINRMGNAPQEKIYNIFNDTIDAITLIVSIFGIAIIYSRVSIWFAIVFLIIIIPMLWLDYLAMNSMNTMFNNQSIDERKLNYIGFLLSNKYSLFELKIFNATNYILNKWDIKINKVLKERVKTTISSQKYFAISTLLIIIWNSFVIFVLIDSLLNKQISIGVFISLIGSIPNIMNLTEKLSYTFSKLSQGYLNIKHFNNFMNIPETLNIKNYYNINSPKIVFENVSFTYPKTNKEVLKNISFTILPNEKIALVGENGSGKTTIIKLLCKLYKPTKGRITINGIDLNNISEKQLSSILSVVFQDFSKYYLTLRENIAFGNIKEINNDSAIFEALNKGIANDILKIINNNLDVNLGKLENDGIDFSEGQWQRIAISRACFSKSSFVILDEPTASLDPIAESKLYETFTQILNNRACIIISHRLGSAKIADRILVLKKGVLNEEGSHEELMNKKGIYSNMFKKQSKWYLKETDDNIFGDRYEKEI